MTDINRPLGQSRQRRGMPARAFPSAGAVSLMVVALALVGVSTAIALRERAYRTPVTIAAVEPEAPAETTAASPDAGRPAAWKAPDGPSIVRVNPDDTGTGNVVIIRDPSSIGQDLRVAHLPDKALIEQSDDGPLPIRGADGRRPFDAYARPWSGARGARVAIVIGGLGVSQTSTQAAIRKLPPEVTLAFASGGNSLMRWMQAARQEGHEIVMQVPLEPFDYPRVDPGRNTLTVEGDPEENLDHLRWALSRITNYTGIMNYMGARFTADAAAMQPVVDELGKRGLLYLDDGSSARSTAAELALKAGVPFAASDAAIDAQRDKGAILAKLDELERIARAKGFALGTGSAFDVTVDAVASWAVEAKKRGIEIVPVSAITADPERR